MLGDLLAKHFVWLEGADWKREMGGTAQSRTVMTPATLYIPPQRNLWDEQHAVYSPRLKVYRFVYIYNKDKHTKPDCLNSNLRIRKYPLCCYMHHICFPRNLEIDNVGYYRQHTILHKHKVVNWPPLRMSKVYPIESS
jgi:hypothetical protein